MRKLKPFGKLRKAYLPWYIVVAESISSHNSTPLLFCQIALFKIKNLKKAAL